MAMEKRVAPRTAAKRAKEEMQAAYDELLKKYEDLLAKEPADRKAEARKAAEDAVVDKAAGYTVESIVKGLADLQVQVGRAFADLGRDLTAEAAKLAEIREAIAIEKQALEELHDIGLAADTLASLLREHEARRAAFDEEMEKARETFENQMLDKRLEWKKEQDAYSAAQKETEARIKKEREREREEYEYNLALARKKDADAYDAQQAQQARELAEQRERQERELAEREKALGLREEELAALRQKAAAFPDELQAAVQQAEKAAAAKVQELAKQQAALLAKEMEADRRVAELKVKSLEELAAKQAAQIEALTRKLDEASVKVEQVALKAIEGASNARALTAINDIAMEQAKNIAAKR